MKIRTGFVSNSSSSSFIIYKNNLSEKQIDEVRNYIAKIPNMKVIKILIKEQYYKNLQEALREFNCDYDYWMIEEDCDKFTFDTCIMNFPLIKYFNIIGIKIEEY